MAATRFDEAMLSLENFPGSCETILTLGGENWPLLEGTEYLLEEEHVEPREIGSERAITADTRLRVALAHVTAPAMVVARRSGESVAGGLAQFLLRRMAALSDKCALLESELARLKRALSVRHSVVMISSLRSSRYLLKRPLQLNLEVAESEMIAEYVEIGIYGVGESEQEAVRDFCQCLIEYYECLREAQDNLARRAREHWLILQDLVVQQPSV